MICVDTVAWLYLFDDQQGGREQQQARAFIESINEPLCTTDLVIGECHKWLVHHGRPPSKSLLVLKKLVEQEVTQILPIEQEDRKNAVSIVSKYADQKVSYTDACIVSIMARLGIKKLFTFDNDFRLFPNVEVVPT